MSFSDYLVESYILLEGGKAIKGTSSITQVQARKTIPELLKHVSSTLKVSHDKVKLIGSAGRKPKDEDMSGDIDLAVEATPEQAEKALTHLAYDKKSHRSFKGLNVYTFAHPAGEQIVQIDLMPVTCVDYAAWSFQAHQDDLKQGYKGAHRNELLFATAKHAVPKDTTERYFYDLSRGLMVGKQSAKTSKKGKTLKGKVTTGKRVLSTDPDEIAQILFGRHTKARHLNTWDGVLAALNHDKFPYADKRADILKQAKAGVVGKQLKLPPGL